MKISVIVPVYNVENYIERCVTSLLVQTYHDIEIILVDDGSTDTSGLLCDKYAFLDSRVCAFHKDNGGLSDARNYGIRQCKGEYVLFVDSDDYIEQTACEELIQIAIDTNADMVSFREKEIYDKKKYKRVKKSCKETRRVELLSSYEAGVRYLYGISLQNSACSRLYKRWLFDHLLFPEGMLAEDYATTYLYISICNTIAIYDRKLYVYRIRDGSIMTNRNIKLTLDIYKTACKKYKYEKEKFLNDREIVETAYCNCMLKTLVSIYEKESVDIEKVRQEIIGHIEDINVKLLSITTRCALLFYKISEKNFIKIMRLMGY